MIVWLAALFVTGGLGLAAWSLRPEKQLASPNALEFDDGAPVTSARSMDLERSIADRVVAPLLTAVSQTVRRFTPIGWLDSIGHTLKVADLERKWTPELILGIQTAGLTLGSVFSLFYFNSTGGGRNAFITCVLFVGVLTFGPRAKLNRAADDRRKQIGNELPDVLDQLTVTVEAGMSFDGALMRAGQEGRGLLAKELLRAVHDMQLGLSRGEALTALADRTDVADLKAFVTAVRQAEKHGFPLANILRLQSLEMREKRRARAEEKAMQVPVKITFPLVFCILPALFIVILGPALLSIKEGF